MEREGKSFDPDAPEDAEGSEAKARKEYREIAERRVRLGLLLSEVGSEAQVEVTDEEVQRALAEQMRRYPGQEREVMDFYRQNPQAVASLRAPIYEDKVVDYLLELVQVTDKPVSKEELLSDPDGHDHDHDHDHDHG
jgi:trigger factor